MTTSQHFDDWNAPEFGMPKATALAVLLVALIAFFCFWASTKLGPKPIPQAIQVTQATLTQLPRPTPPPPPKVVPPPKPIPAIIPKPAPVQSKIVVATKPPPPIHHVFKPIPHPVINHTPPPPTPAPVSQAPQPPAPPTNGIPIYGRQMYQILEADQSVPPALASTGLSGTAYITISVGPDGHVISARLSKSSGIPIIDQVAMQHVMRAHFPPFNNEMPDATESFTVPVEIEPNGADSSSDSDDDSNQ